MANQLGPWFVRVKGSKVSVGIYTCPRTDLWWYVDEVVPPQECETTRLSHGGFVFGGAVRIDRPNGPDEDDDASEMNGCSLTERWWGDLIDGKGDWFDVEEDAQALVA
jgi:hypothetical protein